MHHHLPSDIGHRHFFELDLLPEISRILMESLLNLLKEQTNAKEPFYGSPNHRDDQRAGCRDCRLVGVDPKTVRRKHPPDNPEISKETNAIAHNRRRFDYRRIGVMLERKGMIMNHKKLYRL